VRCAYESSNPSPVAEEPLLVCPLNTSCADISHCCPGDNTINCQDNSALGAVYVARRVRTQISILYRDTRRSGLQIAVVYVAMAVSSVMGQSPWCGPLMTHFSRGLVLATDPEIRVRFPALPDFLKCSTSGTGSTQPREYN
jgi:hypothetical protein